MNKESPRLGNFYGAEAMDSLKKVFPKKGSFFSRVTEQLRQR